MITLSSGVSYVDLRFLDTPHVIASVVVQSPGGVAIIDPGPTSTLHTLASQLAAAGVQLSDVTDVLLTHIHLDHAGAAGTLVKAQPGVRVYVHEKGAPHMIDPSKLLSSAARLYGDQMDRLWGEFLPVPIGNVVVLTGGERIAAGGRDLDVAYTPGHASHHVSYFSADTGVAFVGDTAGVRVVQGGVNIPPTPPPDIDLDSWRASIERIAAWRPETLFLTHFGPHRPVTAHLSGLLEELDHVASLGKASLAREGTDEDRESWFAGEIRRTLRQRMPESDARVYEVAGRFDLNWRGLARYWRKRLS
jgi:glyoxylase-like metal-dependent hydrolase (beta-lactamase superfamily II)